MIIQHIKVTTIEAYLTLFLTFWTNDYSYLLFYNNLGFCEPMQLKWTYNKALRNTTDKL